MPLAASTIDENERIHLQRVHCGDLKIGMFVQELDRPWLETSFMFQGFCIRTAEEIRALQKYCTYVYIDKTYEEMESAFTPEQSDYRKATADDIRAIAEKADVVRRYTDSVVVEKELQTAKTVYEGSRNSMAAVLKRAQETGRNDRPMG